MGFSQSLLELYSGEAIAAKAAVDLCIAQIKRDLSSEQLPLDSFHESAERAFHATNVFVKVGPAYQLCRFMCFSLVCLVSKVCGTMDQTTGHVRWCNFLIHVNISAQYRSTRLCLTGCPHPVQALTHAQEQLRKLMGKSGNLSSSAAVREGRRIGNEEYASQLKISTATPGGACGEKTESNIPDLSAVLEQAELWLNRVELLQSLLGSYFPASLDDLLDEGAAERLRDRLIEYEHYNLANEACTKCKVLTVIP